MTVSELLEELKLLDPELEIAILDGFNGGGTPRTINLGPYIYNPKEWVYCREGNDYYDISTKDGEPIVIMGYGCY